MSKSSRFVVVVLIVIVAVALGYWGLVGGSTNLMSPSAPDNTPSLDNTLPSAMSGESSAPSGTPRSEEGVIIYTDSGFSPASLTVKAGSEVTFTNNSSDSFWPATGMHPLHTNYPGSAAYKCGSADTSTMFDACASVAPGDSWSFTFNSVGTWGYHNHLKAGHSGTIIVTQ